MASPVLRSAPAYALPAVVFAAVMAAGSAGRQLSAWSTVAVLALAAGWQTALLGRHLQIVRRARLDALTGLPDRSAMLERVGQALATRSLVELIFLDLDRFKDVNDTYGHVVGDRVLVEVAERVRRAAGSGAFVARFAGDEFAVLLTARPSDATALAARIDGCLRRPVRVPAAVQLSASVGWASASRGTVDELIAAADAAMYAAKRRAAGAITSPQVRRGLPATRP